MGDLVQTLLGGAFETVSEPGPNFAEDLDDLINFYHELQGEVMEHVDSYNLYPSAKRQQSLPLFIYALRDFADHGELVLRGIAEVTASSHLPQETKQNLFELGNSIHTHIAASACLMKIILEENPTLKIVPPCRERFQL